MERRSCGIRRGSGERHRVVWRGGCVVVLVLQFVLLSLDRCVAKGRWLRRRFTEGVAPHLLLQGEKVCALKRGRGSRGAEVAIDPAQQV